MDRGAHPEIASTLAQAVIATVALDPSSVVAAGGGLVAGLGTRWLAQRVSQAEQLLAETAQHVGGRARLEELAGGDAARLQLLGRVLAAAADTGLEDKIHALARVLANGLQGDAVDDALFFADALAAVETPHVLVLGHMIDEPSGQFPTQRIGWSHDEVADLLGGSRILAAPILAALAGKALIEERQSGIASQSTSAPSLYVATDFGAGLLALLRGGEPAALPPKLNPWPPLHGDSSPNRQ